MVEICTQGSAAHNFKQNWDYRIDLNEISSEEILELAIESGADECLSSDEYHEVQVIWMKFMR